jgi:hypothetical protein
MSLPSATGSESHRFFFLIKLASVVNSASLALASRGRDNRADHRPKKKNGQFNVSRKTPKYIKKGA